MSRDHPQFSEIMERLNSARGCAIVRCSTKQEIAIEFDRRSKWGVVAGSKSLPSSDVQKDLAAIGFATESREMQMRFGPHSGKTLQFWQIVGRFGTAEEASNAALSALQILCGAAPTEWLWVTEAEYDNRGEPNPPAIWPPATH
jgi:hypothetical protein